VNGLRQRGSIDHVHAEITITTTDQNDKRVALFASNGILRDQCAFFLYFGPWRCLRPFEQFYITVHNFHVHNIFIEQVLGVRDR
jgi:hypothetical protein